MPVSKTLKSGFTAAFFLVCMLTNAVAQMQTAFTRTDWAQTEMAIKTQRLDENHVWHALLHLEQGRPQIQTTGFILSQDNFSPKQEMLATLDYLYGDNAHAVCRFPARYLWLKTRLSLPELPIAKCTEINEFTEKAPFDELTLVFTTESVTQPASMMGHTFLKVSGRNAGGEIREHAISYYTDANGINLPKLLWESLVSGKNGIFSLTPYERESQKYLDEEHRNLWEYKIRTTVFQRELIRNHLFELKQTELTYFLHSYNCATVLQNILGLTGELQHANPGWTTPKDVIRQAYQSGLIETTSTYVSDRWTYAFLLPEQRTSYGDSPEDTLKSKDRLPSEIYSKRQHHFLTALNNVLLTEKKISQDLWQKNHVQLTQVATTLPEDPLQLDNQLNPALSQGDSSVSLSFASRTQGVSGFLNFIPASHRLSDKHHLQLAETEVQLFSGAVEFTPRHSLKLHRFTILSMKSLNPWNNILKPISIQTNIGYGALTDHPDDAKSLHAQGAAGITHRLSSHLDVSFLLGGGVQIKPNASSLFISSEVSAIYRATSNTKTLLSWRHWQIPSDRTRSLQAQQVMYLDSGVSIWVDVDVTQKSAFQRHTLGLGIQKSF